MSKISKWVKDMEPIRRLSYFFIFMLFVTYIVFFVFIGGYGNSLTYENGYLSFLSLIISTGVTSIYNLLTRKKRWRPKNVEEGELKEKIKDTMNISTVVLNIFYILIVYLKSSELGVYITGVNPQLLMSILSVVISLLSLTAASKLSLTAASKLSQTAASEFSRRKELTDMFKELDRQEVDLKIMKEIIEEKTNKKDK